MFEIGQLTRLPLGYVGESNTRKIEIDMSAWLEDFPGATIVAEVVRPDMSKYIAATDMENGILKWVVSAGEVRIAGKGFAQIAAIDLVTGSQYRSRVVQTIIADSLEDFTTEVLDDIDPANAWVNRVLKAAEIAAESRDAAVESAELAKQAADLSNSVHLEIGELASAVILNAADDGTLHAPDSADRPLVGMMVYGKSMQNEKPTLAKPVMPVDTGNVRINVQGKNLFNIATFKPSGLTTAEVNGNVIHLKTTSAGSWQGGYGPSLCLRAGVTYTLSGKLISNTKGIANIGLRRDDTNGMLARRPATNGRFEVTYTPTNDINAYVTMLITDSTKGDGDAVFSDVQLEVANAATTYEPYSDGGEMTLTNPDGLAGFLVTRGGNFKTSGGAQYVSDYVDFAGGKRVKMVGKIQSYNGENVGDAWMSSTGALSAGATVYYKLDEPVVSELDLGAIAAYNGLRMRHRETYITTYTPAGVSVSYVASPEACCSDDGRYVEPVTTAWEQRMIERIDQTMVPMPALRDVPKCSSGYVRAGQTMTGINYSAVFDEDGEYNLVGPQRSLSTYYSALENPASKMYTEDKYNGSEYRGAVSSFYGINCSGFVSFVLGVTDSGFESASLKKYMTTGRMAEKVLQGEWSIIPVETENDLFKVRRGDLLLNTVVTTGTSVAHVRIVKDVVHDAKTGRLVGFNMAESWKPYCLVEFYTPQMFLAQMFEDQPYRVVRVDDIDSGAYTLDVEPIAYSRTVYPDKGDGGEYAAGEGIWLYIPDASNVHNITYGNSTARLSDLEMNYVNGVAVYKLPTMSAGRHAVSVDNAPDDPCFVFVQ